MVSENQKRRLILCAALLLAAMPLSAQHASGQTDSLVRLLNARSLEQVETDGRMARKAIEPTFLHNGTYLSCDTALWHVDEKLINCFGNVQLMQGESVLTSGTLDYLIDAPLEVSLEKVAISDEIKNALLRWSGPAGALYALHISYENAEWDKVNKLCALLGIQPNLLTTLYFSCMEQAEEIWRNVNTMNGA